MTEIVVISGKGGTGKTSLTAAFAILGGKDIVVVDCDVDAADMHLLLQPDWNKEEDFYSGVAAVINQDNCIQCGKCAEICRFDAVIDTYRHFTVNNLNCEGCGYCSRICPVNAITMVDQNVGKWFVSKTKANNFMVHARLKSGADNSGKLVAKVKKEARKIAEESGKKIILVDGSPGIGCPVVSSLSGADFTILVTEPTISGLHDLKRVYELVKKFKIPAGCIINKSDINKTVRENIRSYLEEENIIHLASLPYDESFTRAMTKGITIMEYDKSELKSIITESWTKITQIEETK